MLYRILKQARSFSRSDGFKLWDLGFRPFFLLGSLFGVLSMSVWLAFQMGWISRVGAFSPIIWHSHEMIFGFSTAVIAGFALTVVQNWTGKRGVHDTKLKVIVGLWIAARILLFSFAEANWLTAMIDLSFYPVLAGFLVPYLKDQDLKNERVLFIYFLLFWIANLLTHLDEMKILPGYSRRALYLAVHTIILVIIFIGGRVIPFFTESSVAKSQPKTWPWIEGLSHLSAWLFLIASFFIPVSAWTAFIAFGAATVHSVRLIGWQVRRVRRVPLLWVLHLAYLWIVIGFILSGLSASGLIAPALAIHAFAVGGVSAVIYGMMSRVSLGHTGRRLHPSYWIVVGYGLIFISGIARVFLPMIIPQWYAIEIRWSALAWVIAFLIFIGVYLPILIKKRVT